MVAAIVHTGRKKYRKNGLSPVKTRQIMKIKKEPGAPDSFYDLVYRIARSIPRGRVTTYGAIAEAAGTRLSARMVGWAMNAAHRTKPPVPAHRVVNRKGVLTGKHHFPTPELMAQLLENEGVRIINDTVADFQQLFWSPPVKQ